MSQRFSDAELACEWWRTAWEIKCLAADGYSVEQALKEGEIIHRFATLPHAHEEPGAYVFQCEHCDAYWETDNEEHRNTFARNHQYLAHQRQGYTK